jgi:hypothetical protein
MGILFIKVGRRGIIYQNILRGGVKLGGGCMDVIGCKSFYFG